MPVPILLIRADASVQTGTGHVMRMLALAQAWQRRGGQVHLNSRSLPATLASRLAAESITLHSFPASSQAADDFPASSQAADDSDQQLTIAVAHQIGAAWVVADGYSFSPEFQVAIRTSSLKLAMVTDFDYCRQWSADVILNQNPHASREPYACAVAECQRLFGTRYALLRNEFLQVRDDSAEPAERRHRRLLITLGGSDADNVTGKILDLLGDVETQPLDVRVLVGPANPHHDLLRAIGDGSSHRVEILTSVRDMPAQYLWADAAITAGGSSCWEWMYFGLPAAIIVIAANQQPIYDELVHQKIAMGLGNPRLLESRELRRFVNSISDEVVDRHRFRDWVDGYGADRFAAVMDSGVWLRGATESDSRMYFGWANDPVVRENSLQSDEIKWTEHANWFSEQLRRDDRRLFVAVRGEQPVGQIRMSLTAEGEWLIGFSVAAEARGCGLGGEILRLGIAAMQFANERRFLALVKPTNESSAKCFERLGWQRTLIQQTYHYRNA